jgi:hypothetical protein
VIVSNGEVEIRYVIPTDRASEQVRFCHLRLDYLQAVIEVSTGSVLHAVTQLRADRTRVTVMAIRDYPIRNHIGDGLGGLEERLRGRHVAVLAEHHIDQRAVTVDGTIKIAPVPVHLDVGLVDVPAFPDLAAPATAQTFSQCRGELGLPVADRLMTETMPRIRNISSRSRRLSL